MSATNAFLENSPLLRPNISYLKLTGALPPTLYAGSHRTTYLLYSIWGTYYFLIFFATQVFELIIVAPTDIEQAMNNMGVTMLYAGTVLKLIVCKSRDTKKLLEDIISYEINDLSKLKDSQRRIYTEMGNYSRKVLVSFFAIGVVTLIPFFVVPALQIYVADEDYFGGNVTDPRKIPMPFSSWFPFDRKELYGLAFGIQLVGGFYGCFHTVVADCLFVALMVFVIAQLKLLQSALKEFSECDARIVNEFIDGIIIEHQRLVRYVRKLDKLLRSLMFVEFTTCLLQLTSLGFQIAVGGFHVKQLFMVEYLSSMVYQMFLFYIHGHEIILQSYELAGAVWESKWYEWDNRAKKKCLLIMMRSQKPLNLTVGPFFTMSIPTALALLRAAYSYTAVLRKTYTRKHF